MKLVIARIRNYQFIADNKKIESVGLRCLVAQTQAGEGVVVFDSFNGKTDHCQSKSIVKGMSWEH